MSNSNKIFPIVDNYIDEITPKINNLRKGVTINYWLSSFEEFRKEKLLKKSKDLRIHSKFKEFCKNNTIHGLIYVGNDGLKRGERLFWTSVIALSFLSFILFIMSIYQNFTENPIIEDINALPMIIEEFPFPSVTICATYNVKAKSNDKNQKTLDNIFNDYICGKKDCKNEENSTKTLWNWTTEAEHLKKSVVPCKEFVKICYFNNEMYDCTSLFDPFISSFGSCCSFNKLSNKLILRYPQYNFFNITDDTKELDWTIENGYPEVMSKFIWPWRAKRSGLKSGLVVVIDKSKISSSVCESQIGIITYFLQKPTDSIELDQPYNIRTGLETAVEVTPKYIKADSSIKRISPEKRQCFYSNERKLELFWRYSRNNCLLECAVKYMLQRCGCIPFHYPQYENWNLCNPEKWCCVTSSFLNILKERNLIKDCQCYSDCIEIMYNKKESYGTLMEIPSKLNIFRNSSNKFLKEHMAVLNVYFKSDKFTKWMKKPLYSYSDQLSHIGGLLALFMGMSFLTVIEIIYILIALFVHLVEEIKRKFF